MAANCQNGTKMLISRVVEQTVVEQRQDQLGLVQLSLVLILVGKFGFQKRQHFHAKTTVH